MTAPMQAPTAEMASSKPRKSRSCFRLTEGLIDGLSGLASEYEPSSSTIRQTDRPLSPGTAPL